MSEKKQLAVNMITNLFYMAINYLITFFLTSYIVSNIGGEAYGFIGLCNTIINYATLITVALNSVAGRFITIEIHKGNKKKANEYFSSTLVANIILSIIILIVVVPVAARIDIIFNIPRNLVHDVRVLFILISINLIISVISTVFTVSTFITNKLYLSSLANLVGIVVRAGTLLALFNLLPPNIIYVGCATLLSSLAICVMNLSYTRKLCPELKLKKSDVICVRIRELFMSGIWSSVTKLSQILSDGMDLLFSNLWIGTYAMGQLSIAYTLPTFTSQFISMVINLFSPKLTENYAKNNIKNIVKEIKLNMKMTGFFGNIIFFGIVLMGKSFFELWVPDANIDMVYRLAVIASSSVLVSSVCAPLSNVFLMANKLKSNSLVWLGAGFFDALAVIVLINLTNLGVYAVAGVSKFVAIGIYLLFWPIYTCKVLQVKNREFYSIILKYFVVSMVTGVVMGITSKVLWICSSWILFIVKIIILTIVGMIVNYFLFLEKEERMYFNNAILRKVTRR